VIRFVFGLFIAVAMLAGAASSQAPAPKAAPAATYFSGTVTDIKPDAVTVVRQLPARQPVSRTFSMDAKTRVEGKIHEQARVTVRYANQPDGSYRAIHIIVRQ
jgi:hypothetical protein